MGGWTADAAFVAYADRGVAAVKSVDPDLMVTMGAFTNLAVGKSFDGLSGVCGGAPCADKRYPARVSALTRESALDFLDIHLYLMTGRTLQQSLNSMEWSQVTGPVVNGEFGTERTWFGNDILRAKTALADHQVATCSHGISGWLYWTWDTGEDATQRLFFTGTEGGGVIGSALSPRLRPNPCGVNQLRVPALVVFPLSADQRLKTRPEFRGYQGDDVVTLTVDGEVVGRSDGGSWPWRLVPTRDLPLGEPFDAEFRRYRDGRLFDIVIKQDIVLGS